MARDLQRDGRGTSIDKSDRKRTRNVYKYEKKKKHMDKHTDNHPTKPGLSRKKIALPMG